MVVCFQTLSFSKIDNHVLFFKISLQNSFFTNHLTTLVFRNLRSLNSAGQRVSFEKYLPVTGAIICITYRTNIIPDIRNGIFAIRD